MRSLRILICFLLVSAFAPGAALAAPGDPYVVYTANSNADGAVILRADPAAGSLVEVSRNGPQGTLFARPYDLAVEADGSLVVADLGVPCTTSTPAPCARDGRIIRVDPLSGSQSLVSGGGFLLDPAGIAVAPNGDLYVADNNGADGSGAVIKIDRASGAQTQISAGGLFDLPFGIAISGDGSLLVTNRQAPGSSCAGTAGFLLRVPAAGGAPALVSTAAPFNRPLGLTLDSGGQPVWANECGASGLVGLVRGVIATNTVLVTPERPVLDPAGDLLVSDFSVGDGDGGIVKVDSQTGQQSLLRQGDLFNHPLGIAAVVNRPPSASLRLVPSLVAAGRPIQLDGSASSDPEGLRLLHEWDLNGDGVFEAGTGTTATGSRAWNRDGPVTVRLRVTDRHGASSEAAALLNVDGSTPVITGVRASSRVLGVGRRRRPPHATYLRFQLSEAAGVRVAVERARPGRRLRSGSPCRPRARRGRRCVRRSQVRVLSRAGRAGRNRVRISARGLRPGRYRLLIGAADAVGNAAAERSLGLRVVRR